jgi:hypothetical protein
MTLIKRKHRGKKTYRRRSKRSTQRRRTQYKRKVYMRGGNYEKDVTTRTFENFPMKSLNKVVVTVPGRGVMSAAAYLKLKEDEDRNGNDFYD